MKPIFEFKYPIIVQDNDEINRNKKFLAFIALKSVEIRKIISV